jgi:hypothetical protein
MRFVAMAVLALSFLAGLVEAAGPKKRDALEEELKKYRAEYAKNLKPIFESAVKAGQKARAEEILHKIERLTPDGSSLEPLRTSLQGCSEKASAKDDGLAKKLEAAGKAYSDKLIPGLVQRLLEAGESIRCVETLSEALNEYPEHAAAQDVRGYTAIQENGKKRWVSKYEANKRKEGVLYKNPQGEIEGWIPREDKKRWDQGLRPRKDATGAMTWIKEADERALVEQNDANWYVVESEHFTIKTPTSRAEAYEFGQLLEEYYTQFFKTFIAFFDEGKGLNYLLNREPLKHKHLVLYYPNAKLYDLHVKTYHNDDPLLKSDQSAGFYSTDRACEAASHFFSTGKGKARSKEDLATTYHEVTHQLFGETKENEEMRSVGNNWVPEGVATYVETCRDKSGSWSPGADTNSAYLAKAKAFLAKNPNWSLADFIAIDHDAFHKNGRGNNYALSCALTYFLMHADDARYREDCVRFVSDFYAGKVQAGSLLERLGTSESTLTRQFRDFMTKLPRAD